MFFQTSAAGSLADAVVPGQVILDGGGGPRLPKLLYLMVDVNAYILLRVNQGLNTFVEKNAQEGELIG